MTTARRNLLWPLLLVALGAAWLLVALDAVPEAVGDLLARAWPALLILAGLELLLGRRRLPIVGQRLSMTALSTLAVIVALGVVIALAYQKQSDAVRRDNVQTFDQTLADEIRQITVTATLQRTGFVAASAEESVRFLAASYQGSRQNDVTMAWDTQATTGALEISETAGDAIPRLEDYGRATLDLTLPDKTSITALRLESTAGDGELDLESLQIERVEATLGDGSLVVTLPAEETLSGRLTVRGGDIELRVPAQVALTVNLAEGSGEPAYAYNDLKYDLLRDGTLKLKNAVDFQAGLTVWLERGATLRVVDMER